MARRIAPRHTAAKSPGQTAAPCQTPNQPRAPLLSFRRDASSLSAHNGGRRRRGGGRVASSRGSRSRGDGSLTILSHHGSLRTSPRRAISPCHGDDRHHLGGQPASLPPDGFQWLLRPYAGHSEAAIPSAPRIPLPVAPPPSQCRATARRQQSRRSAGITTGDSIFGARRGSQRQGGDGAAFLSSRPSWQLTAPAAISALSASIGSSQRRSFECSDPSAASSRLGVLHHAGATCSRCCTCLSRGASPPPSLSLCGSTTTAASSGGNRDLSYD